MKHDLERLMSRVILPLLCSLLAWFVAGVNVKCAGATPFGVQVGREAEKKSGAQSAPTAERFEVFNLGEGVGALQNLNKPKGTLSAIGGKIKYEETGRVLFTVSAGEIKEISPNIVLGVNTGTFHIILGSGQTYNFAPATLALGDGQRIVEALKRSLHGRR